MNRKRYWAHTHRHNYELALGVCRSEEAAWEILLKRVHDDPPHGWAEIPIGEIWINNKETQ